MSFKVFLRLFIFFLYIVQIPTLSAQVDLGEQQNQPQAVVTLKNGAQIFSQDENFNTQIQEKKVVLNESENSLRISVKSKLLIVESLQKRILKKVSPFNFAKLKDKQERQRIEKEIKKFEKERAKLVAQQANLPFSPFYFKNIASKTFFFVSTTHFKIADLINANSSLREGISEFKNQNRKFSYEGRSPNYFYSAKHCVRPPPYSII